VAWGTQCGSAALRLRPQVCMPPQTWYQCVSGAYGDVESHSGSTVPGKSTSNHEAMPWICWGVKDAMC
jgi:hypothetical protein